MARKEVNDAFLPVSSWKLWSASKRFLRDPEGGAEVLADHAPTTPAGAETPTQPSGFLVLRLT